MMRLILLTALSILTAITFAPQAHAVRLSPPPAKDPPGHPFKGALFLTVTNGEKPGQGAVATLICRRGGSGTHPDAEGACRELAAVGGDFEKLDVKPGSVCTLQYQPVTATAHGIWGNDDVEFSKTYGNPCALAAETGPVFDLER